MPKLWDETIDAHRSAVREAILDAAGATVAALGLRGVTMSEVAERSGIGRATLYKYFPDAEAVIGAWHERQVARHLGHLTAVRDGARDPAGRLPSVLEHYALMVRAHHQSEAASELHRGPHVVEAADELERFIAGLIAEGAGAGTLRDDIPAAELATFCLHALSGAAGTASDAAARRLVSVVLSGLRPSA